MLACSPEAPSPPAVAADLGSLLHTPVQALASIRAIPRPPRASEELAGQQLDVPIHAGHAHPIVGCGADGSRAVRSAALSWGVRGGGDATAVRQAPL
jgi:hypothetical protein